MTDFTTESLLANMSTAHQAGMGFPLDQRAVVEIDGIRTEILCTAFLDRVFVLITQINKVGTVISAWADPKSDGGYLFHTEVLLGRRDDPLLTIYARQIIEKLRLCTEKPLLLGISLKEEGRSRENFQQIINKVLEIMPW
jgi:proteasome assembly chaperone 3